MTIIEASVLLVAVAIAALIFFSIKVLISFNKSIHLINESIDKTKVTLDEANAILKNTNNLTKDVQEVTHMVKETVESVDGALWFFKKATNVLEKDTTLAVLKKASGLFSKKTKNKNPEN